MNNKTIFILGLIVFIFLSISVVSANENTTDIISNDDVKPDSLQDNDIDENQAIITANNYNSFYDSDKPISVQVKDSDGNPLGDVGVEINYNTGSYDYDYTDENGKVKFYLYENVGLHKANIIVDDDVYHSDPVKISVKITKAPIKFKAAKITSKTNKYTILKVTVKDKWGYNINQGTVKFKVNGKTYSAYVKNGVATKKVKLTKARSYTYKAVFSSKNYKSKTVYSKVVVKKAPKTYSYKKGKYSFKVSASQYKKIKYVKQHKHSRYLSTYADFKVKTGKYYNGMPVYAVITTWSGIRNGQYLHYPQVQFVVMYGESTWDWDYLTVHYAL